MRDILGPDHFGSFMQSYTAGLAHAADDGAVNKAGLFRESGFNPATGETNFVASDKTNTDDAKWTKGKRDYAVSQSKAGKIPGFEGSIDTIGGKPAIISSAAMERVADMFGNVTKNIISSIDKQNIDTFSTSFENMQLVHIQDLLKKMLAKAPDGQGLTALLQRTTLGARARTLGMPSTFSHQGKDIKL